MMKSLMVVALTALVLQAEEVDADNKLIDDVESTIHELATDAIETGNTCGLVVLIGSADSVLFHEAYGHRQVEPERKPMERDTLFDLASLTKPIATATSIMKLVEAGRVDLDAPVSRYLPDFGQNGKGAITVRDCLLHRSGLTPDNHLSDYAGSVEESFSKIDALACSYEPQSDFRYSDVGFIVLGRIIEAVASESLSGFAEREVFRPAKMTTAGFLPGDKLAFLAAATEKRDGEWLVGEVHDPRAHRLGGVAGHAGLFATAADLSQYARMILNGGQVDGQTVLKPETVKLMLSAVEVVDGQRRALGWDSKSKYSSNRSELFSDRAVGHTGFTGVSIWIDPERDLFVIVLGSRLHPHGKGSINGTAAEIGTVAVRAVEGLQERTD